MTFDEAMNLALALYKTGEPVVLKDKSGQIIHGEETWNTLDHAKCRVIPDIDFDTWKASTWPQVLDGARQGWLKNKS